MDERAVIHVQVCFAQLGAHILRDLSVEPGTTIQEVIHRSGVLENLPQIDLDVCRVGIYGKLKPLDTIARNRDRIEIYRPLIADPKDSRRKRAQRPGEKKAR